jgi:hypothetical protein
VDYVQAAADAAARHALEGGISVPVLLTEMVFGVLVAG